MKKNPSNPVNPVVTFILHFLLKTDVKLAHDLNPHNIERPV